MFLGREQEDRRYYEPLNLADPNLATVDDRYHSYRTDLQWNNTVHLNDFFSSTVLSATDLTFGYEHTADTAHVRTNDNFDGFPFAQSANASMTDDAVYLGLQSTLWQRLILTGQVRQDWEAPNTPTTWRLGAVFDASRDRHAFQGGLRHGVSRALAVRSLWRGFVRLCRQPEPEAGKRAGLGGRVHHHPAGTGIGRTSSASARPISTSK